MTGRDVLTGLVERVTLNSDEARHVPPSDGERLHPSAGTLAAWIGVNGDALSYGKPPRVTR